MICILIILICFFVILSLNRIIREKIIILQGGFSRRKINILKRKNSYDVINLGSTHAFYDFDYDGLNIKGMNMAMKMKTIAYDYKILEKYISKVNPGGLVFLVFDLFSFGLRNYENGNPNEKYYNVLDDIKIDGHTFLKKIFKYALPIINPKKWIFIFRTCNREIELDAKMKEEHAEQRVKSWKKQFHIEDMNTYKLTEMDRDIFSDNKMHLRKMISLCRKRGVQPVIIITPAMKCLTRQIPKNFYQLYLKNNIDEEYGNEVTVLDYFYNEDWCDGRLYIDSDCLNKQARQSFTKCVLKDIDSKLEIIKEVKKMGVSTYELSNGIQIPNIAFGTGVVWKYSRNKRKLIGSILRYIKIWIKNKKIPGELRNNYSISKMLYSAVNKGIAIDTGRRYSKAELKVGKVLTGLDRSKVFLSSKVSDMDVDIHGSVEDSFNISLKNLKTEYLDCLLLHYPSGNWKSIYKEMENLYRQKKIKAIGVCNFKIKDFEELHKFAEIMPMVCQVECNPLYVRTDIKEYCKNHSIQMMAYSPLRAVVNGKDDLTVISRIAESYNKTVSQVIMRWHIQNNVIPVFSTTSLKHFDNNIDVFNFELSDEEMASIDSLNRNLAGLSQNGIDDPNYCYNY
jgi:Aldo/keto reductases, related to diketogulonate reductase